MKNNKLFAIILSACVLSLAACGEEAGSSANPNSGSSVSVSNSASKTDTSKAEASKAEASKTETKSDNTSEEKNNSAETNAQNRPENNKAIFDSLLDNPDDKEYFAPATNDYMYEITEKNSNQIAIVLYSFDEEGHLVQYIDRRALLNGETYGDLEDTIMSKDRKVVYYPKDNLTDYFGKSHGRGSGQSDKQHWETARYAPAYADKVYMSPGISEYDTYMDSTDDVYSLDTLKELAEQFGSDYIIEADPVTINVPEKYYTSETTGEKILYYNAFEYLYCSVYVFDDLGELITKLNVEAYGSPEQVEDSWYAGGLGKANEATGKRELRTGDDDYKKYMESHIIYKNLQYWIQKDSKKNYKWAPGFVPNPEYTRTYYSVPYITEKQLDNMKTNGYGLWNK